MRTKFDEALAFTLKWEGGYSLDSSDPGGETYCGISRVNHPDWPGWSWLDGEGLGEHGTYLNDESLRLFVRDIYRDEFWTPLRCDDMPGNVATAVFDTAVNVGKSRASRWLQGAVGVVQDGAIGPKTIAAVNASPDEAIRGVITSRSDHYVLIVAKNPALRKFMRGWTNRVEALRQEVSE
jgi:lysozyme family protein